MQTGSVGVHVLCEEYAIQNILELKHRTKSVNLFHLFRMSDEEQKRRKCVI